MDLGEDRRARRDRGRCHTQLERFTHTVAVKAGYDISSWSGKAAFVAKPNRLMFRDGLSDSIKRVSRFRFSFSHCR